MNDLFVKAKIQYYLGTNNIEYSDAALLDFTVRDLYWITNCDLSPLEKIIVYENSNLTRKFFCSDDFMTPYSLQLYELRSDWNRKFPVSTREERKRLFYECVIGEYAHEYLMCNHDYLMLNRESDVKSSFLPGLKWINAFQMVLECSTSEDKFKTFENEERQLESLGFVLLYSRKWQNVVDLKPSYKGLSKYVVPAISAFLRDEKRKTFLKNPLAWLVDNRSAYLYDVDFMCCLFDESRQRVYLNRCELYSYAVKNFPGCDGGYVKPNEQTQNDRVSVIGFSRSEIGTGEDTRTITKALSRYVQDVSVYSITPRAEVYNNAELSVCLKESDEIGGIQIYSMPPTTFLEHFISKRDIRNASGYKIAYFPWEFDEWKREFDVIFDIFDEIWVVSDFLVNAFANPEVPVRKVPLIVELSDENLNIGRADYGLPDDQFLFFLGFDIKSSLARKNPIAAIKAFIEEYSGDESVGLVIKTCFDKEDESGFSEIDELIRDKGNIYLINRMYPKAEVLGLLGCCDVFVSSHRSEGFGRYIAEAMLLKIPTVVTNFSGNIDFCSEETAYLVDYRLTELTERDYPFASKLKWAEVSIDSLRAQLRAAHNSVERDSKIQSAYQLMKLRYSEASVSIILYEAIKRVRMSLTNNVVLQECRSRNDFEDYIFRNGDYFKKLDALESSYANFVLPCYFQAYSYPAQDVTQMLVDAEWSGDGNINWRERLVCSSTGFNNRMRAIIHIVSELFLISENSDVFISEFTTPLYSYFASRCKLVGSEWLGPDISSGWVNEEGVRHENISKLSFDNKSFDFVLSFDCFEHLPDIESAFAECYRVLRADGRLIFSVPFHIFDQESKARASINSSGELVHHMEPEYHFNPFGEEKDILVYHDFGWDILDSLKRQGFRDAYALFYSSIECGYLGGPAQQIFVAIK